MAKETILTVVDSPVISVSNVSKRYKINTPKDGDAGTEDDGFYALRNISFELQKGDIIGIIGSNGSGKTTLLKILSSVTKPTEGKIKIRGSVTSILDIGSNFHPELTGRENTRMQLRLNHVSNAVRAEKTEMVKNFSGIGDFFDQPVKYYSNGMFLRLAFSVAFNNDSDILILDEVLAVGDDSFKMKCGDHFQELKSKGKSIIFVSHSKTEVLELSTKCLWLDKGKIRKTGEPLALIAEYYDDQKQRYVADQKNKIAADSELTSIIDSVNDGVQKQWADDDAPGNKIVKLRSIYIGDINGSISNLQTAFPVQVKILVDKLESDFSICALLVLHDMFNEEVLLTHSLHNLDETDFTKAGKGETGLLEFACEIPPHLLKAGNYYFTLHLGKNPMKETSVDKVRKLMGMFILPQNIHFRLRNKEGEVDYIGDDMKVSVRPALKWTVLNKG